MKPCAGTIITFLSALLLLGLTPAVQSQTAKFSVLANAQAFSAATYGSANGGVVLLEGFAQPGDGGGGLFTSPPTASGAGTCMTTTGEAKKGTSQNPLSQISGVSPFPLGLVIGMQVIGDGLDQTTTVTGFSVANNTVSVSPAPSDNITVPESYTFTLPAMVFDGWSFLDGGGYCFTRASSTFSQKEWGAISDGTKDDTTALQNWLYANEPHLAVAGTSVIESPLYCGVQLQNGALNAVTDGGVIQGPPSSAIGQSDQKPAFVIEANDYNCNSASCFNTNFTENASINANAMLVLGQPDCGVSATGLVGNANDTLQTQSSYYNLINATVEHNSILGHSQLYGGFDGVACTGAGDTHGNVDFTVEDSSVVLAVDRGIVATCSNEKIEDNVISETGSGTGNAGVSFPGSQAIIANNLFEQNYGSGLSCGGGQLALNGNYFNDNGLGTKYTYNLVFAGCDAASVVGNIFGRSGAATEEAIQPTSQVFFQKSNDSISVAGNTNFVGNSLDAPQMRPDFDIELQNTSGATVTDFSYADSATPQNAFGPSESGIFGPNATALIGPVLQPVQRDYLTGLNTQIVSGLPEQLELGIGAAADSLNAQLITLSSTCTVNLANNGVGGLDTGSIAPNAQYNFFVFAQGGYASPPNCIATLGSNSAPNFAATYNDGSRAAPYTTISGFVSNGSIYIVNVTQTQCTISQSSWICPSQNPFGGIAVGDVITDNPTNHYIPPGTTISALSSTSYVLSGVAITPSSPQYVAISGTQAQNLYEGEMMGNGSPLQGTTFDFWVPGNTYIVATYAAGSCPGNITAGPCIALNNELSCLSGASCQADLVASGVYSITLSQPASCTGSCQYPDPLYVFNDRYRLAASLYTDPSHAIVGFTQHGDSFLLNSPSPDIVTTALVPGTPTQFLLRSVPSGQPVEAFGRCVANAIVHIFSPGTTPGEPVQFSSGPPGYDTQMLNALQTFPHTSFPFRVWTDPSSHIDAESGPVTSGTATLYCMTDGYVLPRSP